MDRVGYGLIPLLLGWWFTLAGFGTANAAEEAELVVDLQREPIDEGSRPGQFLRFQGRTYFVARDEPHGGELWRSDGTRDGTELFLDLYAGRSSSRLVLHAATDRHLFFTANHRILGRRMWISDGSRAGTRLFGRPAPWNEFSSGVQWLRVLGDRVVFGARVALNPSRLGLVLADLETGDAEVLGLCDEGCGPRSTRDPQILEDTLYFLASGDGLGRELWRTDGTTGGTVPVADICPGECSGIPDGATSGYAELGGALYLGASATGSAQDLGLWKIGSSGASPVSDLSGFRFPRSFTPFDSRLYFQTFSENDVRTFWSTDGSSAGTRVASELMPYGPDVSTWWLRAVGDRLFFEVGSNDSRPCPTCVVPRELWAFDRRTGLSAMTFTATEPAGTPIRPIGDSGGRLIFQHIVDYFVRELWSSDGTPAGTVVLSTDLSPVSEFSAPDPGGQVLFGGDDDAAEVELYATDGTPAGTVKVRDIREPHASAGLGWLQIFDGELYFVANLARMNSTARIWRSDGTAVGTGPATIADSLEVRGPMVAAGNRLFVVADFPSVIWALGARTPPEPLYDSWVGGSPFHLTPIGSSLYFVPSPRGQRLWRSDGTAAATLQLVNANPAWTSGCAGIQFTCIISFPPLPQGMTEAGGSVFFFASSPDAFELWATDGTPAGTRVVQAFGHGLVDAPWTDNRLTALPDGQVLFAYDDPDTAGFDLWVSDGRLTRRLDATLPGTAVRSPVRVGESVFFVARDADGFEQLWSSDGTVAGTQQVPSLPADGSYGEAVAVGRSLFFVLYEPASGAELWRSDGSAGGTYRIRDILPGPESSDPVDLTVVGKRIVFSASDATGRELWVSGGTEDNTLRVADLAPGPASSSPERFTAVADRVFFVADDGVHGRELFVLDLPPLKTPIGSRIPLDGAR